MGLTPIADGVFRHFDGVMRRAFCIFARDRLASFKVYLFFSKPYATYSKGSVVAQSKKEVPATICTLIEGC